MLHVDEEEVRPRGAAAPHRGRPVGQDPFAARQIGDRAALKERALAAAGVRYPSRTAANWRKRPATRTQVGDLLDLLLAGGCHRLTITSVVAELERGMSRALANYRIRSIRGDFDEARAA